MSFVGVVDNGSIIGSGEAMTRLRAQIAQVAASEMRVLISGPTGAGKELVAHEIHRQSRRSSKPLVIVNCAALTETLLESELFGHVRGSFTGADRTQKGKLEIADGGTLFLDEVGDMTLRMQGLILRFLESGEIQPVGFPGSKVVKVRVITATNAELNKMVEEKTFRKDLYFRLKVAHLEVPPLAARAVDIPELVTHFMHKLCSNGNGYQPKTFSPDTMELFGRYKWPGNVRELKNVVEKFLALPEEAPITLQDLPVEIVSPAEEVEDSGNQNIVFPQKMPSYYEMESSYFRELIMRAGGKVSVVSMVAGLPRSSTDNKVNKCNLRSLLRTLKAKDP